MTKNTDFNTIKLHHAMRFYLEAGVEDIIGDVPVNRYGAVDTTSNNSSPPYSAAWKERVSNKGPVLPVVPLSAVDSVSRISLDSVVTLSELRRVIEESSDCALSLTAKATIFSAGLAGADLMVVGGCPSTEEDREGIPFAADSGALLGMMLGSIERNELNTYYTTLIPWRPPGNRPPTAEEVEFCKPFLYKHIMLAKPKLILALGELASQVLLRSRAGIGRLRGEVTDIKFGEAGQVVPVLATFHPAYLMRSPYQKHLAWKDMMCIREKLSA